MARKTILSVALLLLLSIGRDRAVADTAPPWLEAYRAQADRLIGEATNDAFAWRRLATLTDTIGHRLSGSPQLDQAIQWALAEMKRDGLENVHAEKVMVPKWIRGKESADILQPSRLPMAMLGLGGSVATPPEGVEAALLVVRSYEELESHAAEARGRIVLFNVPFTELRRNVAVPVERRVASGPPWRGRHAGPVGGSERPAAPPYRRADVRRRRAADSGRRHHHRGRRPAAAHGRPRRPIVVRLRMEARLEPDVESANVVGEIRGRERPEEIVVVSGHLDSWDVGAGATDDGGGCVVSWEALRIMKKLNLRPRRTVRVVLWTNEENGGRGGVAYRDQHRAELARHVLMMESDNGVFRPLGFGFAGSDTARQTITAIATLLSGLGASDIVAGGDGADIAPSTRAGRIPGLSLEVDASQYFLIHHTQADTVDKIDPVDMAKCAAAVTVMAYVVADLPFRLGE